MLELVRHARLERALADQLDPSVRDKYLEPGPPRSTKTSSDGRPRAHHEKAAVAPASLPRYFDTMKLAQSRVTSQGQVSVPAEVRRRLGLAPGSVLEWEEEDGAIVVRRARRFTSEDIHRALFPEGPTESHSLSALKAGIAAHMIRRHARG